MINIKKRYFTFLVHQVNDWPDVDYRKYQTLFKSLLTTRFTPIIKFDQNREADGYDLRNLFYLDLNSQGLSVSKDDLKIIDPGYCSILEMLIGTIVKVGSDSEMPNGWLFFQILRNIGISALDDYIFEKRPRFSKNALAFAIERINTLTYEPTGNGGMFVSFTGGDLRESEIKEQYDLYYRDFIRPLQDYI